MKKRDYPSEYKVKLVLEVLREERPIGEIASAHEINPTMLNRWKREFLERAPGVFDDPKQERIHRKAGQEAAAEKAKMLSTIGQLTMERDFLLAANEKRMERRYL